MATILLSVAILAAAFAMLAVRILTVRGSQFRGTCGTNNPYLGRELGGCQTCVRESHEECERLETPASAVRCSFPPYRRR